MAGRLQLGLHCREWGAVAAHLDVGDGRVLLHGHNIAQVTQPVLQGRGGAGRLLPGAQAAPEQHPRSLQYQLQAAHQQQCMHLPLMQVLCIFMAVNPRVIFVLTNLAFQAVIGNFGVYSIIKYPMGRLYAYDEDFLGIIDAIALIGETAGAICLLFLTLRPVKGYLIFALLNTLAAFLLFIPRYMAAGVLRDLVVCCVYFAQAFFSSALAYPQIIFSYYYDEDSKKCEHSIWYSLTFLGDITSLIFAQLLVTKLGMQWEWVFMLWHLYLVAVAVGLCLSVGDEVQEQDQLEDIVKEEEELKQQQHCLQASPPPITNAQQLSRFDMFYLLLGKVKHIMSQPRMALVVVSFGLVQGLYTVLLFWVPYYYTVIGQEEYASVAILVISVAIALGGVFLEVFLFQVLKLEHYSKPITFTLFVLSCLTFLALWTLRHHSPSLQIGLLFAANFLLACPFCRISAPEIIEQAQEHPGTIKTLFLLAHVSRDLIIVVFTLLVGFCMKADKMSFWGVVMVNVGLALAVECVRKGYYRGTPGGSQALEPEDRDKQK